MHFHSLFNLRIFLLLWVTQDHQKWTLHAAYWFWTPNNRSRMIICLHFISVSVSSWKVVRLQKWTQKSITWYPCYIWKTSVTQHQKISLVAWKENCVSALLLLQTQRLTTLSVYHIMCWCAAKKFNSQSAFGLHLNIVEVHTFNLVVIVGWKARELRSWAHKIVTFSSWAPHLRSSCRNFGLWLPELWSWSWILRQCRRAISHSLTAYLCYDYSCGMRMHSQTW